jgi:hypothetical protein
VQDFYLRAYAIVWSSARQIPEALRRTQQTIERDPRYAWKRSLRIAGLRRFSGRLPS